MEISFVNKSKAIQPQQQQDANLDPARNISTEENKKYVIKNKVDSLEISSSHSGSFEDKRIAVAKSALLYEVTVGPNSTQVQELSEAVKKGAYDVPANILADIMLK